MFYLCLKIADAALTEKKDTPQILLKMWRDGYLHMQVWECISFAKLKPKLLKLKRIGWSEILTCPLFVVLEIGGHGSIYALPVVEGKQADCVEANVRWDVSCFLKLEPQVDPWEGFRERG